MHLRSGELWAAGSFETHIFPVHLSAYPCTRNSTFPYFRTFVFLYSCLFAVPESSLSRKDPEMKVDTMQSNLFRWIGHPQKFINGIVMYFRIPYFRISVFPYFRISVFANATSQLLTVSFN